MKHQVEGQDLDAHQTTCVDPRDHDRVLEQLKTAKKLLKDARRHRPSMQGQTVTWADTWHNDVAAFLDRKLHE